MRYRCREDYPRIIHMLNRQPPPPHPSWIGCSCWFSDNQSRDLITPIDDDTCIGKVPIGARGCLRRCCKAEGPEGWHGRSRPGLQNKAVDVLVYVTCYLTLYYTSVFTRTLVYLLFLANCYAIYYTNYYLYFIYILLLYIEDY